MANAEITEKLRPLRKKLVEAAEKNFAPNADVRDWPDKAQFSRLTNACTSASCAEEIINYLRYQSSRERAPWKRSFAEQVIQGVANILSEEKLTADDVRVEAWCLYATYLSRAFAYAKASSNTQGGRRDR
jgi:hypothetical protein